MLTPFTGLKSIDVANTASDVPIGTVDITPSGPFMGQIWQLLNLDTAKNSSTYLLSSYYLGAQKKLFVTVGKDAIYVPFLINFTHSPYDLSWVVSPSSGSGVGSGNATYSMSPAFLGGAQALSVNTVTKQPFLEAVGGSNNQRWEFTPVQYINDASFSAAALSAEGTSTATINSNTLTHSAAATSTSPSGTSSTSSETSANTEPTTFTPQGAVLAAIIATPVILFVVLLTLGIFSVSWHRKALDRGVSATERKIGYPSQQILITPTFSVSRPPTSSRGVRSIYAASLASSSEYVQSSHRGFHPLLPSPRHWGSRDPEDNADTNLPPRFFGSSALGDYQEVRPVSPLTPGIMVESAEGVIELSAVPVAAPKPTYQEETHTRPVSPRSVYAPRIMHSPLSSVGSVHDLETQTGLTVSKTKNRPISLISRWLL